jgi:hypothetical protein
MFGIRNNLMIPLDGVDRDSLLGFWSRLLPDSLRTWFVIGK